MHYYPCCAWNKGPVVYAVEQSYIPSLWVDLPFVHYQAGRSEYSSHAGITMEYSLPQPTLSCCPHSLHRPPQTNVLSVQPPNTTLANSQQPLTHNLQQLHPTLKVFCQLHLRMQIQQPPPPPFSPFPTAYVKRFAT